MQAKFLMASVNKKMWQTSCVIRKKMWGKKKRIHNYFCKYTIEDNQDA